MTLCARGIRLLVDRVFDCNLKDVRFKPYNGNELGYFET